MKIGKWKLKEVRKGKQINMLRAQGRENGLLFQHQRTSRELTSRAEKERDPGIKREGTVGGVTKINISA